jgi:hypothetical protein
MPLVPWGVVCPFPILAGKFLRDSGGTILRRGESSSLSMFLFLPSLTSQLSDSRGVLTKSRFPALKVFGRPSSSIFAYSQSERLVYHALNIVDSATRRLKHWQEVTSAWNCLRQHKWGTKIKYSCPHRSHQSS